MNYSSYCESLFDILLLVAPFVFLLNAGGLHCTNRMDLMHFMLKRGYFAVRVPLKFFFATFAKQCSGLLLLSLFCTPALIQRW